MKVIYAHSSTVFVMENRNPSPQLYISHFPEALVILLVLLSISLNSPKQLLVLLVFDMLVLGIIY